MRVDLLHLFRNLRRAPASAIAAVLTLSLTLGAGASIFAIVDAVLLTPPPFVEPAALVTVGEASLDERDAAPRAVSYTTFEAWRERVGSRAEIEASDGTNLTLTGLGAAERVNAVNVTPGYLSLLGVAPSLGRSFRADDVGQPLVIISHAFWRGKLAAETGALGGQLVLGRRAHTIVGILPERFSFAFADSDIWRPFPVTPVEAMRSGYRVFAMARLGHSLSPVELERLLDEVSRTSSPPARVVATRIAAAMAGEARGMLGVLGGAAVLALLIAFTNLAGLLIVRSIDRRRELAVRSALGARRSEIARQLLLEAQSLVAIGTVGGILVAAWATPIAGRLALQEFSGLANRDIAISWRVIVIMTIAASICALISGTLPAFGAMRQSVVEALRRGATPPPRDLRLRRTFVACQVALAFVLLVSVALVGRSLLRMLNVSPGFDAQGVLALSVSLPSANYPNNDRIAAFYSALHNSLEGRLGRGAVSIADEIPLTGNRTPSLVGVQAADTGYQVVVRSVARNYFDVMRIPIADGRSFEATDDGTAPRRVIVSRQLADRLFEADRAIGRRIWLRQSGQTAEVIGISGEIKQRALDEGPSPIVYVSGLQEPSNSSLLLVRSPRPDADVAAIVREEVARLDRDLPVYGVRTMSDVVAASPGLPARRVLTSTVMAFALLSVVLAAIGLFGVVAHDVARRRVELGLRIALGAEPKRILGATLGQGGWMVGSGLLVGGLLSIWASHVLGAVLSASDRLDLLTVGAPAALLMLAAAGAVLPAAIRAARTDPIVALRDE
jgi:putative ABC transport system permease protein